MTAAPTPDERRRIFAGCCEHSDLWHDGHGCLRCDDCKAPRMTAPPTGPVSATPPEPGEDWSNPMPEQIAACAAYDPDPDQYGTAAPTGPDPRTDAAPDMRVHREGDWWVIEVPGVGVTQARPEEDIERMARDLVESLADDGDPRTDAAVER